MSILKSNIDIDYFSFRKLLSTTTEIFETLNQELQINTIENNIVKIKEHIPFKYIKKLIFGRYKYRKKHKYKGFGDMGYIGLLKLVGIDGNNSELSTDDKLKEFVDRVRGQECFINTVCDGIRESVSKKDIKSLILNGHLYRRGYKYQGLSGRGYIAACKLIGIKDNTTKLCNNYGFHKFIDKIRGEGSFINIIYNLIKESVSSEDIQNLIIGKGEYRMKYKYRGLNNKGYYVIMKLLEIEGSESELFSDYKLKELIDKVRGEGYYTNIIRIMIKKHLPLEDIKKFIIWPKHRKPYRSKKFNRGYIYIFRLAGIEGDSFELFKDHKLKEFVDKVRGEGYFINIIYSLIKESISPEDIRNLIFKGYRYRRSGYKYTGLDYIGHIAVCRLIGMEDKGKELCSNDGFHKFIDKIRGKGSFINIVYNLIKDYVPKKDIQNLIIGNGKYRMRYKYHGLSNRGHTAICRSIGMKDKPQELFKDHKLKEFVDKVRGKGYFDKIKDNAPKIRMFIKISDRIDKDLNISNTYELIREFVKEDPFVGPIHHYLNELYTTDEYKDSIYKFALDLGFRDLKYEFIDTLTKHNSYNLSRFNYFIKNQNTMIKDIGPIFFEKLFGIKHYSLSFKDMNIIIHKIKTWTKELEKKNL